MSTVRLIWKCNPPRNAAWKQLCESLMIKAAQDNNMDTAVIRKEPHNTTKVNGKWVKSVPHITGDIVDTKANKGFALHWNLTSDSKQALADKSPSEPNPELWELKYVSGKGFVLAGDDTETVRDV